MKEICGNAVLREVAFCYTEASFCEEWIVRQMYSSVLEKPHQTPPENLLANAVAANRNPSSLYQERKLPVRLSVSTIAPPTGQCGIAAVTRGRKLPASHMLRIIGGKVVRRGSYPWQVAILNRFKVHFKTPPPAKFQLINIYHISFLY